jgi:hypothetical protein
MKSPFIVRIKQSVFMEVLFVGRMNNFRVLKHVVYVGTTVL